MKKILSNDERLVSMVNKALKDTKLMEYITNIQLRQDAEDKSIYYVVIEIRFTHKQNQS